MFLESFIEEFEDTVNRRTDNTMAKRKRKNNDLLNKTQITTNRVTRTPMETKFGQEVHPL